MKGAAREKSPLRGGRIFSWQKENSCRKKKSYKKRDVCETALLARRIIPFATRRILASGSPWSKFDWREKHRICTAGSRSQLGLIESCFPIQRFLPKKVG